jgi:leucyl aminopeptidase (aminopeptidase T)
MITKRALTLLLLVLVYILAGCDQSDPSASPLTKQEQFLVDVFAPQSGEKVLIMVDIPRPGIADHPGWQERREMANEWLSNFESIAEWLDITVHPLFTYEATGLHNGPLPENGTAGANESSIAEILSDTNIAVAMTEYSATAPLIEFTDKYPQLRVASMPMVSRDMEDTALAADYTEVARKSHILAAMLDKAVGAEVSFSSGHEMYFDLRYRSAHADDGQLHADKEGQRVINLPSGEAYIAPYEGEIAGKPSLTAGMLPVQCDPGDIAVGRVEQNRIVEVLGEGQCAKDGREILAVDEGLTNVAELGLGVNDKAVITGNILEDEKVFGVHWAIGRSDHIGGTVGPEDFENQENVEHRDFVYPKDGSIEISSLFLIFEDGTREEIIRDGSYLIF